MNIRIGLILLCVSAAFILTGCETSSSGTLSQSQLDREYRAEDVNQALLLKMAELEATNTALIRSNIELEAENDALLQNVSGGAKALDEQTTNSTHPTENKAIEAVVEQINAAEIECTNSMYALMKDPIASGLSHKAGDVLQKYHDDLVAIDISGCPDDFRVAFVNYYQAVLGSKEYADSITGWNGALKGLAYGVGALLDLHDNTDKAFDPLEKAGNEFALVCTKYNVDIK